MAIGLSAIPQILRSPKTDPIALTELGPWTEVLHLESELLPPLPGTRILLPPLLAWKMLRKLEGSLVCSPTLWGFGEKTCERTRCNGQVVLLLSPGGQAAPWC